ncbi:hypothetical protein ECC1470_16492, partial [Escherichia coli ECC-1470]
RGEHCNSLISDLPRLGLSPLARGTPVPGRGCISILRFIPAGAGNTRWIRVLHSTAAVYPRWRGEHLSLSQRKHSCYGLSPLARGTPRDRVFNVYDLGLSPLARGTHDAAMSFSWASRFIPAGAGNTADRSV